MLVTKVTSTKWIQGDLTPIQILSLLTLRWA